MLGGIAASLGIGLAGNLFANNQAEKEQARYDKWIQSQIDKRELEYQKDKNTNYLDTAEGRGMLTSMRKTLKKQTEGIDNTAVKTGSSAEQTVASKEAAGENFTSGVAKIAGYGTSRKDAMRREYRADMNSFRNMKGQSMQGSINRKRASAANIINNASGAAMSFINAGSGSGGVFSDMFKKGGSIK